MNQVEAFANNIAGKIAGQMNFDNDKKAVIAYGLTAIIQMITIFFIISVIGLLCGFWYEGILIFTGVGIIRKSTGGAHSRTMLGCIIISVLSVTVLSWLSRYPLGSEVNLYINLLASCLVYIVCFIVFYIRVPVDTPNKPIVSANKIKRLRKQSFIILTVFFILSITAVLLSDWNTRFLSIGSSIRLTMLWQMFTLTKTGAFLFGKIDAKIKVPVTRT